MSEKRTNKAKLELGIISNGSGKVGGVIMSKNGVLRGSVHRKYGVRQKKLGL